MITRDMLAATDFIMVRAALVAEVGAVEALIVSRIHWRTSDTYAKDSHRWSDGELWWNATIDTIADETGVAKGTVKRALSRLAEGEYILRETHFIGGITDQSYSYRLNLGAPFEGSNLLPSDGSNLLPSSSTKTSKTEDKKRARETPIPDDWSPTESHRQRAITERLDIDALAEDFRNHALQHDRRAVRWDAAFTRWLMNAASFRVGKEKFTGRMPADRVNEILAIDLGEADWSRNDQ